MKKSETVFNNTDNSVQDIEGSICLVTGGGGSIGSELCRQIMKQKPEKLIIADIYENGAYELQQELFMEYGRSIPLFIEIASVRDRDKIDHIFEKYSPRLVFHAAAHKHVPLMERCPEEAVKNNVGGTLCLANAAAKYKAEKFILISTDKAVNPTSVMGATKRCCEMIMKDFSIKYKNTSFITVRIGNVLGSNGSVVPLFEQQIRSGGPVTVTHPDITRYFTTIPNAVSLILQAEKTAASGQIYVLNMGEPIKILTLAESLIKKRGYEPYKDIKIEFTGLREGEKLHEELCLEKEQMTLTENKQIFIGSRLDIPKDFSKQLSCLLDIAKKNNSEAVVKQLKAICPSFTPDKRIHLN